MRNRSLRPALGVLVLAFTIAACGGSGGSPVTIKTLDPTSKGGCYTSGVAGNLVTDPAAGTAIIDDMTGSRKIVTWPQNWTARSSGSEVEVINRQGTVAYRTGTHVNLLGGYWLDGSFLVCNLEPLH